MKLSEVASRLGLPWKGEDCEIRGVSPLENCAAGDLTFALDRKRMLGPCDASAMVVPKDLLEAAPLPALGSETPALDAARVGQFLGMRELTVTGIHPRATVDPSARLAEGVAVGANAVIGARVVIGEGSVIHAGAVIHDDCLVGARCVIHSNVVIGGEGFGYEFAGGVHHKIPHFGIVRLEDDVEIGSGTTIDRARFGETVIGQGSKLDNLIQIGHNFRLGRHVVIVAQAGLAGSVRVEDYAVIGGQVGVVPHAVIGRGARIASTSGVAGDVPAGATWSGWWGKEHRVNLAELAALRKLPEVMKRLRHLLQEG
ncbi:MAG: UDP-3-O-(3-hydroxymyristoyl)glucosamine N-acyltransferase [Magnetococcales bacterium]|nr:UDP-3-O-(3-hydroxymyristoyl)glucosamine N-acyltransferase [Magnetococcales bacterium]